jgi:1,4-alpha-glucan branching enzyme
MAIEKKYSSDKKICHLKFLLPKEINKNFNEISVVGDFNNWDPHKNKMTHTEPDGSISLVLDLESGKEYHFKYLCDNEVWLIEPDADKQVQTHYGDSQNSVLVL